MTPRRLNLTRDQLAAFLPGPQQIKQFELLFSTVDTLEPIVGTDFEYQADTAAAAVIMAMAEIAKQAKEAAAGLAAAEARANQALAQVEKLSAVVQGLQMAPPQKPPKRARHGAFYDTTTQTATAANTAQAIRFNSVDASVTRGVQLGGPGNTRVYVDTPGIYNFDMSFQLDKTSGGTGQFFCWFRKNGVDVPDSASQIRIQGNDAEIFSSLNFFFKLKAGDYIEIMFSVSDISVELLSVPATAPHPAIPSIILTVSNSIEGST